jgi:acetoin utilization deacetylase AcuC-like enzyme
VLELGIPQPHVINVGLRQGQNALHWRRALTADVLPRLAAFKPDLILVSAGFDAHHKVRIHR